MLDGSTYPRRIAAAASLSALRCSSVIGCSSSIQFGRDAVEQLLRPVRRCGCTQIPIGTCQPTQTEASFAAATRLSPSAMRMNSFWIQPIGASAAMARYCCASFRKCSVVSSAKCGRWRRCLSGSLPSPPTRGHRMEALAHLIQLDTASVA